MRCLDNIHAYHRRGNNASHMVKETSVVTVLLKRAEHGASETLTSASARREPLPSSDLKYSDQLPHGICPSDRALLVRVREEKRGQGNNHIGCNQ